MGELGWRLPLPTFGRQGLVSLAQVLASGQGQLGLMSQSPLVVLESWLPWNNR
jgi:hypothetical protein